MRFLVVWVLLVGVSSAGPSQAQWQQYLGPNGDATSPEVGLLDSWPADGPREVWRIDVGPGYGGAAVDGGEVIIHDREHSEADILRVLDLKTGQEKWRYRYEAKGRVGHEGSRCTPAVTKTHIFTTGQMGDVYAFNRKTRQPAWSVNLLSRYPDTDGSDGQAWGYGMNPLLVGDTVVVASPSSESPGLIAFDQASGEVAWTSVNFGDANMYSSPQLLTIAGQRGIAVRTIKNLYFINPDNGELLFQHPCYAKGKIPITPVTVMPDGEHVFVTQGYEMGSVMLRVTRNGGGFEVAERYRTLGGSQIHPPIVIGDHLYINLGENATHSRARRQFAGLACLDPATGEVVWNTGDDPFFGRGGLLFADGKLIAQDAESGTVYLVHPSAQGFKPISSFRATDAREKRAWAPLTLSDRMLILRDQDEMVCFDLREN